MFRFEFSVQDEDLAMSPRLFFCSTNKGGSCKKPPLFFESRFLYKEVV